METGADRQGCKSKIVGCRTRTFPTCHCARGSEPERAHPVHEPLEQVRKASSSITNTRGGNAILQGLAQRAHLVTPGCIAWITTQAGQDTTADVGHTERPLIRRELVRREWWKGGHRMFSRIARHFYERPAQRCRESAWHLPRCQPVFEPFLEEGKRSAGSPIFQCRRDFVHLTAIDA